MYDTIFETLLLQAEAAHVFGATGYSTVSWVRNSDPPRKLISAIALPRLAAFGALGHAADGGATNRVGGGQLGGNTATGQTPFHAPDLCASGSTPVGKCFTLSFISSLSASGHFAQCCDKQRQILHLAVSFIILSRRSCKLSLNFSLKNIERHCSGNQDVFRRQR